MRLSVITIATGLALSAGVSLADNSSSLANTMAHNPEVSSYQTSSLNPAQAAAYQDPNNIQTQNNATINQAVSQIFSNVGDGPAVGIKIGRGVGSFKTQNTAGYDNNEYGSGGIAGIDASYGHTFSNQFYLGAEALASLQDIEGNYTDYFSNNNEHTYKYAEQYGISLVPGYHFSPSDLLFLRTGLSSVNVSYYNLTLPPGTPSQYSFSANMPALELGIGYSAAISQNLALSLEYDYFYHLNNYYMANGSKLSFSEEAFMLGLSYQLDQMNPNNTTGQAALNLTGPYAGMNAGRNALNYDFDQSQSSGAPGQSVSMLGSGYFGRIHLGYGWKVDSLFYIGTEAFGGYTNTSVNVGRGNYSLVKEDESYGLSIIPGYLLNNSNMFYVKLGMLWTKFEGNDISQQTGWGIAYSKLVQGYQFGVGYETALTTNLSLLLEYDYDLYKNFSLNYGGLPYTLKLNEDLFSVGLNYRF